jgi:hypothetical protein
MSDKFRIWDSIALSDAVKLSIQIKSTIEETCIKNNLDIRNLPGSLVPTEHLYNIVSAYEAAYNRLLELDLVKTGNLKSFKQRNNIH